MNKRDNFSQFRVVIDAWDEVFMDMSVHIESLIVPFTAGMMLLIYVSSGIIFPFSDVIPDFSVDMLTEAGMTVAFDSMIAAEVV